MVQVQFLVPPLTLHCKVTAGVTSDSYITLHCELSSVFGNILLALPTGHVGPLYALAGIKFLPPQPSYRKFSTMMWRPGGQKKTWRPPKLILSESHHIFWHRSCCKLFACHMQFEPQPVCPDVIYWQNCQLSLLSAITM